ncbi:MAG TPA: iron-sulfur cluster biosynthesis family protein [Streptosporangiaceae bacterium]|nr:iron-sulfur cluster biosynthesis family protein [Streptosporangiaceae bacterium]
MLTLTRPALEAIRTLTTQPGLPTETGLRIAPDGGDGGSLTLAVSDGPQIGDEVIESEGVRVFVQSDAAVVLDDKSLDAEVDDQGVTFRLGLQPE